MALIRPLLAPREVPASYPSYFEKLQYPLEGSPKLDGIRGYVNDGFVLSRTAKPLPSAQVQCEFSHIPYLDSEIIVGSPTAPDVYNTTQSHVMSYDKPADEIKMFVFDFCAPAWHSIPFYERHAHAGELIKNDSRFVLVPHTPINDLDELLAFESTCLEAGYEGIMLRNPVGIYKTGRATFMQNIIYKLKRFIDTEGVIVGFEEQMVNMNEQTRDELGFAKRSSAKAGLVPGGTLGKFYVTWNGITISVGPGNFNHAERLNIWLNRELYLGKILKYRYFGIGMKDLPRHPRAIGFRDLMDM